MPKKSDKAEGNSRAASTRIGAVTAKKLAGQIRHDLRRGPQPNYVDADRQPLNRVLIEPQSPGQMRSICESRRALRDVQRGIKSNSAVATRGLITFGSEAAQAFERLTPDQQDAAFREVAQTIANRLSTSLHGLVVHMDEATIHAHYQLAAYDVHGNPISKATSPKVLSELQDIVAQVMARHCPGIERGHRYGDRIAAGADFADTIYKSVKTLHRTLPAKLATTQAEVAEKEAALIIAQKRVAEMQGRVDKLTAKERELTAAEAKRLETYQKRLTERLAEVETAETAIEAARLEIDRLAKLADAAEVRRAEADEAARIAEAEAAAVVSAAADKAGQITQKAVAVATAVAALAEEMAEGTLGRDSAGKIVARDPERLRPGLPDIRQALNAGADARAALDRDRADLADKIRAADEERGRLAALRDAVESGLRRAEDALRSVLSLAPRIRRMIGDKAVPPAERPVWRQARAYLVEAVPPLREAVKDERDLTRAIMDALRTSAPAEKPVPEADPDDGPGFGEP